jgi:hypothetical protein
MTLSSPLNLAGLHTDLDETSDAVAYHRRVIDILFHAYVLVSHFHNPRQHTSPSTHDTSCVHFNPRTASRLVITNTTRPGHCAVPTQSLSANAPTPPAVLRGTSANGAMLSLEINVSLLQAAQISGMALVLNSTMRASSNTGTGDVPPHAQVGAPYTYPYAAAQPPVTQLLRQQLLNKRTVAHPQEKEGKT